MVLSMMAMAQPSRLTPPSLRAKRSNPTLPQPRKLDCFVASLLAMTSGDNSMPHPENLPRFRWRRNLPPRLARAGGQRLDELPVRGHLGAVAEIEGVFQARAQMPAEIGTALVQRPDFGATDRGDLPMPFRALQL